MPWPVPAFPAYFYAGLAAAAGPLLIHLLNRRRFRVLEWGAMDFLREAVRRSRRILRLRDVLLMALRMACLVLFGLALSRPFLAGSASATDPDSPVHAVLVIDNSLSMAYEELEGTLLDAAKAEAKRIIEGLPPGSRISVVPLCGSANPVPQKAFRTKEDAAKAVEAVEVVDRSGRAAMAIDQALDACRQEPDMESKHVVFLSDQQAAVWPSGSLEDHLEGFTGKLHLVSVAPRQSDGAAASDNGGYVLENVWVDQFELQDGLADVETPAVFLGAVRCQGDQPQRDVRVTLALNGRPFADQTIDLEPGQRRMVEFPVEFGDALVDLPAEPGRPAFVTAELAVTTERPDRLPEDNRRFLVVPVVAGLKVVFVDQYGRDEDPSKNLYGETVRLRRLLAPVTRGEARQSQLVQVYHRRIEEVDREMLRDARLVVIAGVADPGPAVEVLRQYVEQGGSVVIAAGGRFDPQDWTVEGWREGLGILPVPLEPVPVGHEPGESNEPLTVFSLDPSTMSHDYFLLKNTSREELDSLYRSPVFFKAVAADESEAAVETLVEARTRQIADRRQRVEQIDGQLEELANAEVDRPLTNEENRRRDQLRQERDRLEPAWLTWAQWLPKPSDAPQEPAAVARREVPNVLARFSNEVPFLVERRIGRGQVMFISTAVQSDWNTMTKMTNAVFLYDRIFRILLRDTLPPRTIGTTQRLVLPVDQTRRHDQFLLEGPEGEKTPLPVSALGSDRYGLVLDNATHRGVYRALGYEPTADPDRAPEPTCETTVAVNGPDAVERESELEILPPEAVDERLGGGEHLWIERGAAVDVTGTEVRGQQLWKWILLAVLAFLLLELALVARPKAAGERAV